MRIPSMLLAFSSVRSTVSLTATGPRRLIALTLRGGSRSNMSSSTSVPTLVDATTAVAMHKAGKCKFLDGSWHMAKDRDSNAEFLAERVPGACHFDIESIKDASSDLPHMLPSTAIFSTAMDQFGISNDDHVIVYARHGSFSAPRVWYMLKVYHQLVYHHDLVLFSLTKTTSVCTMFSSFSTLVYRHLDITK